MNHNISIKPSFILLFSIHLNSSFKGFGTLPSGISPLSSDQTSQYFAQLTTFETRLLGKIYYETKRLVHLPLGRITLHEQSKESPTYADVSLLIHKSGAALWEVWLSVPLQLFNVAHWIHWLDSEVPNSLVAQVWNTIV